MLLLSGTRLQRGVDLPGLDDESLRRVADVREGKTGDQGQVRVGRWIQHPDVARIDDERPAHLVLQIAVRGRQADLIADADALERTKEAIAVRRERAVARLPR